MRTAGFETVAAALAASLPRHAVAMIVERLIDHLDQLDGDTDLECCGDDEDVGDAEIDGETFLEHLEETVQ